MKANPALGALLITLSHAAIDTPTWADCGSRIDGNNAAGCQVATSVGTTATTQDIVRTSAQWSVGGSAPTCRTTAECALARTNDAIMNGMQNAANSARPYYQAAADAVTGAANTVADSYATRAQNQVDASYGINCAIGSEGYTQASLSAGIISATATTPIDRAASIVGLATIGMAAVMEHHEERGRCD